MRVPFGFQQAEVTAEICPVRVSKHSPDFLSQTFAVLSPADSMRE